MSNKMGKIYQKRLNHSNRMDLRIEQAIASNNTEISKMIKQKFYCVNKVEA